jgi:hypothetical protein
LDGTTYHEIRRAAHTSGRFLSGCKRPRAAYPLLGVTGFIEVAALAWWGVELWRTMNLARPHRAQLLRASLPLAAR